MPLNVAAIILGCILSMLLSIVKALGPISIPTPPTVALTEIFHADTVASVHPLLVSWYLISSVCVYLCYCMHIMSILCSTADAVSSGSSPILFTVLTLNVAICVVCLHFSSFCLSSVADFSDTNLSRTCPFFTRSKNNVVYVCGLSLGHSYLSMVILSCKYNCFLTYCGLSFLLLLTCVH